ncbi:N-acetylmuramoyl-L-alanine amidase [Pararhodobacter zhoushanensis]|uniref:N-acetylmuramoyl-L-alanine amidase n=1 Tax=Pararhodobacter zhoushanensis TaxID=2479545 RepID=A0ABT3H300_9RHOB|nr:N-acetylmuramoyl-L-alanine amidase [Pararhodobacter zhoushanensis]MCW1934050.1 N-acetylmuramoyl-L-alanine amidase [Pararhodobacter zhoushanensis]
MPSAEPIAYPSPNFGPRRNGLRPDLVVIHFTEMRSAQAALDRLCDPSAEVSAHYLIGRNGQLWQLVDEPLRAWHAGAGAWQGREDVNSRSIGIELDNDGQTPFSAPLMARLEALLPGILARWSIPPSGVIAHSDMAPARKIDPGPRFDWQRLARQRLALWPDTAGDPDVALKTSLDAIGYPDVAPDLRLAAFRLRFRANHQGPEDTTDRSRASAVADALMLEK